MALSIRNDEADRLARELAEETGESLTDAVLNALRERLDRERRGHASARRRRIPIIVSSSTTLARFSHARRQAS